MCASPNHPSVVLDEPNPGSLMVRYAPDDDTEILENPPRFSWLPTLDEGARYVLRVSETSDFPEAATRVYPDIPYNFFTPDKVFEAGTYFWCYAVWDRSSESVISDWSKVRRFTMGDGLPETPLPNIVAVATGHPRLWLNPNTLAEFKAAVAKDPGHCAWSEFFENSVACWPKRDIVAEPARYPGDKRVRTLWRQMYIDCQEVFYAIKHMAIAGQVLDDEALLERAKDWLLSVAAWDPKGPTERAYNDEAAFRVAIALAWGYDWLHDRLSEDERETVRDMLLVRTRQVADHVIKNSQIHLFPYDSHAVRSLSAVLVHCCIALYGECDEAEEWLDYTVGYLFNLYSPWGGRDGGWAEGPHYWTTGMSYLLEAGDLVRNFTGVDLFKRPFFQKTGDFALYTKSPDTRRSTFGDDSTLGDLPSRKVGYNIRHFAGITGNSVYQWYLDTINRINPGGEKAFYNYGWWDFAYDEMVYRWNYDFVEAANPKDLPRLKWFRDIGWAAIQSRMDDPKKHIQFTFKSSRFGSISHSHGDQNAFHLFAYGDDLAIQSGYYVAYGCSMHVDWRRQTRSKNAVLIGGQGQPAGLDKGVAKRAVGNIVEAREETDHIFIRGDATSAYLPNVPHLKRALRDVYFVYDSYFVIVDRVELNQPDTLQWLFHTNNAMELGENSFRVTGESAGLYGQFVLSTSGNPTITQTEGYPGVDEGDYEGLHKHWHLSADFAPTTRHSVVTLLVPYRKKEPKRIFHFIDDQGFAFNVYFTDEADREFKITVRKSDADEFTA